MCIVVSLGEKSKIDFKIQGFYQTPLGLGLTGKFGNLCQAGTGRYILI